MAKDKRGKNEQPRQVNLAQKAGASASTAKGRSASSKKKKKMSAGKRVVMVLLIILIVVSVAFVATAGVTIYQSLASPTTNREEVELSSYDTTPVSERDKVSYFLVGLMGEEDTADMAALSLVCYDKAAGKVQILQVPGDTYLGDDGTWTVKKIKSVFGNPKPLDWCESCGKQVFEPEIEDGKHTACGTDITQKAGSATENLINVFNDQYDMAVDNFFLLPQQGLVDLVNSLGGIDISLEADIKVEGITYKKGTATLPGEAALYYAVSYNYKNTPDSDVERLQRQRKVFTALFQRLTALDEDTLSEEIFGPLMYGANPIRMNSDREALASLMIEPSDRTLDDATASTALAALFTDWKEVPLEAVTFYLMPGESAKSGSDTYYSVHRADLAALLQESFNPYGAAVSEGNLQVTELSNKKETDVKKQTMAELQVTQSGQATTTAAPDTSTTQAAA